LSSHCVHEKLEWFNKHAAALYDAHTSLKAICKTLCLPNFVGNHGQDSADTDADKRTTSYIISSNVSLTFGRPFKPMLSAKTSFEKCLDDISNRHRVFVNKLPDDHPLHQSLTFRNPVFSVETKLDGERMIVHASKDGTIKIHSRVGNWYR
jgi:ATP-dependent DNA ligase